MAKKKVVKKKKLVKRKRRRYFGEMVLSFLLTIVLFFGGLFALYWVFFIRTDADEQQEETEEIVYGNLPPVRTDIQIQNILDAPAGTVVDAAGLDESEIKNLFTASALSEEQLKNMEGVTWDENQNVVSAKDLMFLRLLYMDFNGQTQVGEMIVNQAIAAEVLQAFYELYQAKYPIEKMVLLDAYNGDLSLSQTDNNTLGFALTKDKNGNYEASSRSLGLSIDINPFYNPQIAADGSVFPLSSQIYVERDLDEEVLDYNHMIYAQDDLVPIMRSHGLYWAGENSNPQYQLFQSSRAKSTDTAASQQTVESGN